MCCSRRREWPAAAKSARAFAAASATVGMPASASVVLQSIVPAGHWGSSAPADCGWMRRTVTPDARSISVNTCAKFSASDDARAIAMRDESDERFQKLRNGCVWRAHWYGCEWAQGVHEREACGTVRRYTARGMLNLGVKSNSWWARISKTTSQMCRCVQSWVKRKWG